VAEDGDITGLLRRWREGNSEAEGELFRRVMPDLRRLARYFMRGERKGHSLQSTELVDEIYLRLAVAKDRDWQDRGHFFAFAARAMRRYLIDYARRRGSNQFVPMAELEDVLRTSGSKVETALTVAALLSPSSCPVHKKDSHTPRATLAELWRFGGPHKKGAIPKRSRPR
jgi:RNA polymerase sigma factor (TIGR02999 family)